MRAFTSIFKRATVLLLLVTFAAPFAFAADGSMDEDEFSPNPFTDYAEFNQDKDEEAEARFFQHGRFFGVSVGMGMEALDGNRGILWSGGFPTVEFKLHYWFDFNVALDMGFYTSPHNFKTDAKELGAVNANLTFVGVNLKYYFDTKNLSAPISFANPYVLLGAGGYTKTETSLRQGQSQSDTSIGLAGGAGLEFPVKHRSLYFALEGKVHFVNFTDTHTDIYQAPNVTPKLQDLTGRFYTVTGAFLFTW